MQGDNMHPLELGSPSRSERRGSDSTSLTLLAQAQAQDPLAWNRLFTLYEPLILYWCHLGTLREDAAEEVRQEVFGRVFLNLADFRLDAAGHSFRGWLRVITRHCICDYWERNPPARAGRGGSSANDRLREVPDPDSDDPERPDPERLDGDERMLLLRRALALIEPEFAEKTWRAFWRVVVDRQGPARVAEELGVTRNAVYLAKGRVLRRFREEFAGLIDVP
jgi:RNA polymerase sigma-70 factor (ECF subfamily)